MNNKLFIRGFTLIELMITVAIIAILAAVAYPSYTSHIRKVRRTEAKTALLEIQVAQEKFFLQNNAYSTALNTTGLGLGYSSASPTTTAGYYTLSYTVGNPATTYTAIAAATGNQASDTACLVFTILSDGTRKSYSNTAMTSETTGCW